MSGLIVHEWVAKAGGSENVVEEFAAVFPTSDLQVLWSDAPDRFTLKTYETWLARTPLRRSKAAALPFLPSTWRAITAHQDYEWLLVSSHLFAHHVKPRGLSPDVPKLVYTHTPARYIWEPELDPRGASRLARAASAALKPLDRARAQEATSIVANSSFTRARVQRAWQRDAEVIYPPVDTRRIAAVEDWASQLSDQERAILDSLPEVYILGASRFVAYKRLDQAISAGEAAGVPVVLAGGGPDEQVLRARASEASIPVVFVATPSTALLYALYQRALVYVFMAIEDFGIMPVEAMAAGTPSLVPHVGGAAESVRSVDGGAIIEHGSREEWIGAIDAVGRIDRGALAQRSHRYSRERFRAEVLDWVTRETGGIQQNSLDPGELAR